MNIFQTQLKVENKRLIDLHNDIADGKFHDDDPLHPIYFVTDVALPAVVSVEEFEATQHGLRLTASPAARRK
jgi:hypothetical protein